MTHKPKSPPAIVQICPFDGYIAFEKKRKGVMALFSDGSLRYLYMHEEKTSDQTTWSWVWEDLPLPSV